MRGDCRRASDAAYEVGKEIVAAGGVGAAVAWLVFFIFGSWLSLSFHHLSPKFATVKSCA